MVYFPLKDRLSKVDIAAAALTPDNVLTQPVNKDLDEQTKSIGMAIKQAREKGSNIICAFGAHAIKNGLGPLLGEMLRKGWITHLASNGAAVIHDWEFSWLGKSSEDVRENVAAGRFGTWEETGFFINLALAAGSWKGLGYAASVGAMIADEGIMIPEKAELLEAVTPVFYSGKGLGEKAAAAIAAPAVLSKAAAALEFLELIKSLRLDPGFLSVPHPFKQYSLLAAARESDMPFTCHPMFGHDIIYTHKANRGSAVGRTAERDFLEFAGSVEGLEGGVYLSVGSAVMSPMIFEKALSMARNAFIGKNAALKTPLLDCSIYVVDLQESNWDWQSGEPPMDNPAYYLRYMKTFNRMGCRTDYITADNREFFISLYRALEGST